MSLYEEAREHQLRDWGATTLGMTYVKWEGWAPGGDIAIVTDEHGRQRRIAINYDRGTVTDVLTGRREQIRRPE